MAIGAIEDAAVAVDMVPFIDIISLLMIFMVAVSDMTQRATGIKMFLPSADQAIHEKEIGSEGRIVIQLVKDAGQYVAVIERSRFQLGTSFIHANLKTYLKEQIASREAHGKLKREHDGKIAFPVKLRIPRDAPMAQVERIVATCASAELVNIHYAADNSKAAVNR